MHFQLNAVGSSGGRDLLKLRIDHSSGGGGGDLLKLRIDQCIKVQIFSPNCECRAVTF